MNDIKWIKIFLIIVITINIFVYLVNFTVDPLSETQYNIFNIDKVVQTVRREKITKIKNITSHIDNIIIGSSRSMRLNPELVSTYLKGSTFNFSVSSALPEDYLGIMKFLIKNNKIPKNII